MTKPVVGEYLEKYSVAPSPSRDYYGIKVFGDQVILYTWKISHGPHLSPIVRTTRFCDFGKEKTMQNEIERVFGEPIFRYVETIARGYERTLLTLPKHLIKKLVTYLTFKDVLKLSILSHIAKEVFNDDVVWEVLYRRHKMGLVYRDERVQGSSYGWKRLFKDRQMHKFAKTRETKNLSSDRRFITPRSSTAFTKKSSVSIPLKTHRETVSAEKFISTELQVAKFPASKSGLNFNRRHDTADKQKTSIGIKGCKLLVAKRDNGDDDRFAKIDTSQSLREPEKDLPLNFKSTTIGRTKEKSRGKGIFGEKTKNSDKKTARGEIFSVSNITAGKYSDQKSEFLVKKFTNSERKSNPFRTGVDEGTKSLANTESSARWCEQNAFRNGRKKSKDSKNSSSSEIRETDKASLGNDLEVSSNADFGFEELIRASITEEYSNSDNLLPPEFWKDRIFETNSNMAKRSARKYSKPNFSTVSKTSQVHKNFLAPRRPGVGKKANELVAAVDTPAEIPAKKSTDVKVNLKYNSKNFSRDESEVKNYRIEEKSSFTKSGPQNMVAKYKSRAFPKTGSCDSLDSKFIATKSSQGLAPNKRGNLKKL